MFYSGLIKRKENKLLKHLLVYFNPLYILWNICHTINIWDTIFFWWHLTFSFRVWLALLQLFFPCAVIAEDPLLMDGWHDVWFFRFLVNMLGYATIVVPGYFLISYLKRSNYLDRGLRHKFFARLNISIFLPWNMVFFLKTQVTGFAILS